MANKSALELAVETGKWDAGLKKAKSALDNFVSANGGLQSALEADSDKVAAFVKMMENIDSTAKTTKGQLRELTQTTADLTVTYRTLTDEEKNSPFGKALADTIDRLTEKAGVMRDAMDDVTLSIKNAASDTRTFDQVAGAATVATSSFQTLQGASKLLGIEMGNDVEVIAKLQAAMAVTNGLSAIQTALQKQSAFMQGVNAAKTALATIAQQAYAVATGEATAAQVAFNVAANANPYGLILGAVGLLVGAVTAFAAVTRESTDEVKDAQKEMDTLTASVDKATEAYERLANKIKNMGIGGQKEYHMLRQSLTDQYDRLNERYSNIGHNMRFYEKRGETDSPIYKELAEEHQKIKEEAAKIKKEIDKLDDANRDRISRLNQYKRLDFSDVTTQAEAESAIAFLKEQIKHVDNTTAAYKQLKRAIEYAEKTVMPQFDTGDNQVKAVKQTVKKIKEEVKKEPIDVEIEPTGYITRFEQLKQNISIELGEQNIKIDETTLHTLMKDAIQKGIDGMDLDFASIQEQIGEGMDIPDEAWQKMIDKYNAFRRAIGENPIEIDLKTGNESKGGDKPQKRTAGDGLEKFLKGDYGKITSGVSSIAGGIQQMGIELPQELQNVLGVMTGISSILSGMAAIMTLIEVDTKVAATAATVDNFTPFFARGGIVPHAANGYFVPGNNFSGDVTPIMANAGELILNKSSQNNLASFIQEAEGRGHSGNGLARVSGEQIWIALNAYTKRTGQGEIVTWKD